MAVIHPWERPENVLQNDRELNEFADLVAKEGCLSLLEIGSKFGGSMWRLSRKMPKGSRLVAVDLPRGTRAWNESSASLKRMLSHLKLEGYDTSVIWGNSRDKGVIDQVRALGPYDLVFIDADHTMLGVKADWENYGPMGRLVAFHDIAWRRHPEWVGVWIEVPQFWNELKKNYRYQEFIFDDNKKDNGIGVVWRDAAR